MGEDAPSRGLFQYRDRRDIRVNVPGGIRSSLTTTVAGTVAGSLAGSLAQGRGMHSWRHDFHPYSDYLLTRIHSIF